MGLNRPFKKGKIYMSVVKYQNNPLSRAIHRDEFLTPFDQIFDEFFKANVPSFTQEFGIDFFEKGSYPRVDVIDFDDKVIIEAEVPGLTKSDVNVEVQQNVLTVSGVKSKNVTDTEGGKYIRRELKRSNFRRSFTLGENIEKDTVSATFENGILQITLNKVKPAVSQVRKVTIK